MKIDTKLDTVLRNLVENLPGLNGFKRLDSTFGYLTTRASQLAGYENPEHLCGLTDYDLKADAVRFADDFRAQDKIVISNNNPYQGLDILRYADDKIMCYKLRNR
jgi:hypothetical protein